MRSPKPVLKKKPDFSEVIEMAEDANTEIQEDNREPKDHNHMIYEAVMIALYGESYWDWLSEEDLEDR